MPIDELTNAKLAEWKALADAATPGPWIEYERETHGEHYVVWIGTDSGDIAKLCDCVKVRGEVDGAVKADAEFIAAAREAVPVLIDEVERLREENERNANR